MSLSERKIRAVLVGCGGISRAWLQASGSLPDLEIVGMVDVIEEAARNRATSFGLDQVAIGSDLATILQKTTPDVVFNCTTVEAHTPVTLLALQYNCHVLSEKPLADTLEHAQQIVHAADQKAKVVAVMQNYRYRPAIRRLKDFLTQEIISPITTINSDFYLGAHFGGFRDHLPHVLLLDMAIHTFDAVRFLTDLDPISVFCQEWNPPGSWYGRDASAIAIFQLSHNVTYTYRGSWCAEGLATSWNSEWRLIGQKGSVWWNGEDQFRAQVVSETDGFQSKVQDITIPELSSPDKEQGHLSVIQEFLFCIRHQTLPETRASDNIKSLAMTLSAIRSSEAEQKLPISW